MAKVDIVMGIYNCEEYLADSIESIVKQSFKDWRLIMCDDCSTDDTYTIAEKFAKRFPKKILLLKNKKNMGLNYTLNKCLKYSTAVYVARQDGDDLSKSDRFEKEVLFLDNHKEYSFVSCAVELFDCGGKWGELHYKEKPTEMDFLSVSPFCHAAVMIRRDAFSSVGYYTVDKKLLRVEDFHLWFKLYSKGYRGYNLQEVLYGYRDDNDALARRTWTNRLNEYHVRKIGYRMLKMPLHLRLYKYRPIVLGLLPKRLYYMLHSRKNRIKNNYEKE